MDESIRNDVFTRILKDIHVDICDEGHCARCEEVKRLDAIQMDATEVHGGCGYDNAARSSVLNVSLCKV